MNGNLRLYIAVCGFLALLSLSCQKMKDTAKETLNKSGEVMGRSAGEIAEGLEKAFDIQISLSDPLKAAGISMGQYKVSSQAEGTDNTLSLYLIFSKNFSGRLQATLFSADSLEGGRSSIEITAKQGDAAFHDFRFDSRTNINAKDRIRIE